MFNIFALPMFMIIAIVAIVLVYFAIIFFLALGRGRDQSFRCPGCGFLVDIKDVEKYGYVCPDCKTDWRVHPLKNDDDEDTDVIQEEREEQEELQSSHERNKRLVR